MTSVFTDHIWSWLFLLGLLAFGAYAAWAIKNEKKLYIENGVPMTLSGLEFFIPGWWTPSTLENGGIKFDRQDTRYDWFALFEMRALTQETLQEELVEIIKGQEIELDIDTSVIHAPLTNQEVELVRVEGTATQSQSERLYLDVALIRDKKRPHNIVMAYSRSSILNGCVEGPYFEAVIKGVKLTREVSDS